MRTDDKGRFHTLEEDIFSLWKAHGWRVLKEIFHAGESGSYEWTITAKNVDEGTSKGRPLR